MPHTQIRQAIAMGTFDFFIWTDAEFRYSSDGSIHFPIYGFVSSEFHFFSKKASSKNENRPFYTFYRPI